MKDVAKLAGVSQTTVSFVLNEKPGIAISDETKQRIRDAVEALGYRPNLAAQTLRTSKTNLIGLISDEVASTPYAGQLIEGAQDATWAQGKLLILINTGGDEQVKNAAVEAMLDRRVEGIIYATMYHRVAHPPDQLFSVPTVLLDCFSEDRSYSSVVPDEVAGGRTATEHLLSKGHRRVGFINNLDPIPATFGREEGYRQALMDRDISLDESLVVARSTDSAGGYQGTLALMQLPDPPTAIFCFNDRMAMGAYDALRKLGLSIPADVAVVGFDNQVDIAAHLYPALTTLQLPHYEMGQWAASYLLDSLEAPTGSPAQYVLDCPLILRDST
jgi:LacI family transcriptional regulator